ncbi:hypothetical protein F7725_017508 [Dissostichus mawsoni]|uniref:Uncharacterized protein n=1 Tax=Dissostichus mawsoni TaxID=36200 RepID=A0A7J5Z4M0_DISMA|nr:hypothetical protein F7725_017508 [Dissostichus mawsoni]
MSESSLQKHNKSSHGPVLLLCKLWTSRQPDHCMPESSDVLHSLVDQSVDRGEGYLKGLGHHTV